MNDNAHVPVKQWRMLVGMKKICIQISLFKIIGQINLLMLLMGSINNFIVPNI